MIVRNAACWILTTAACAAGDPWTPPPAADFLQLDLRPSLEAVCWVSDDPPPALLVSDDEVFLAPVLRLDADGSAGDRMFLHATLRADRGSDAVTEEHGDIRLDEIFLRWRMADDQRLNVQIGSFPTVFGGWVAGHDFFDDPFLTAPLPYSRIVGVQTRNPAAVSAAAIAARDQGSAPPVSSLAKENWASVIWGPAYATGASVFGSTEHFDYAAEVKNCGLSAHPDSWQGNGFGDPAVSARIGWRPDAAWAIGASASRGPWLEDSAPGVDPSDLRQTALGLDLRWAHRAFIVTGECILTEFSTPDAGDLRAASMHLGGRWKFSPGMWLAARFGGLLADEARGPAGEPVEWQPGVWRAELAAGWQPVSQVLVKAGWSCTRTDDGGGSSQLLGLGIGWRF